MAYGQTGAGKTYSLSSIAADAIGMIPRAAAEIFQHIEQARRAGERAWLRVAAAADRCEAECAGQQQPSPHHAWRQLAPPLPPDPPAPPPAQRPQDGAHEYSVYMSYVQLYMELIQVGA